MKKLITILFLVFGFSSIAYAESSLPKCQGDDYKQWTNCYGEIKFPRNEYKGEWKDGKFEGKGTLTEAWGGVYTGDFVNNLAHGFGKQVELDGSWWEGEVENDYLVKGKFINSEGTIFTGTFNKWLLEGPGTIEYADGSKYVGNFKKDLLDNDYKFKHIIVFIDISDVFDDNTFYKLNVDNKTIALLARQVERKYVGVAGGIMDQMVSSIGVYKKVFFLNCKNFYLLLKIFPSQIE